MRKLFWKFFFGFWLCLIAAALATGSALFLMREEPASRDLAEGPRAQFMLEAAQAVLEGKGPEGLIELLEQNPLHTGAPVPVFAVSASGQDLLGRDIPENLQPRIAALFSGQQPPAPGMQKVLARDGSSWVLFIPKNRRPPGPPPDRGGPGGFPGAGLIVALLASLLFAGALAYTFSKPLNTLKHAFREAGKGKLGIRIAREKGGRQDEIGELLQGFDLMASEIESRIEHQKALLHDVSHELRSPLARLNMAVGLARQKPDQLETSLQRMERETERLDSLIGELLSLSRLDSPDWQIGEKESHNVIDLLNAVVEDALFEAGQQGKQIAWHAEISNWEMTCEPELLQRAFDNLIRNALKHTPEGTEVQVIARRGPGGGLDVRIRDAGPGVAPEVLDKLFTPFFKQGPQAGHGLGLAIARKAIGRHGGTLHARLLQPSGMEFVVGLPRLSS